MVYRPFLPPHENCNCVYVTGQHPRSCNRSHLGGFSYGSPGLRSVLAIWNSRNRRPVWSPVRRLLVTRSSCQRYPLERRGGRESCSWLGVGRRLGKLAARPRRLRAGGCFLTAARGGAPEERNQAQAGIQTPGRQRGWEGSGGACGVAMLLG